MGAHSHPMLFIKFKKLVRDVSSVSRGRVGWEYVILINSCRDCILYQCIDRGPNCEDHNANVTHLSYGLAPSHKSYPKWEFDWSYKVVMVCKFTAPVMPSTMPTCLLCFALSPWHQAIILDRMPKKVDSLHSCIHNRMLDSDMCFRVGLAFISCEN